MAKVGENLPEVKPTMMVAQYLEKRERGWSWDKIAEHFSTDTRTVDPDQVFREVQDYLQRSKELSELEYRRMQLRRLEKMIDALWDLAIEHKDLDHLDTLLKVLKEISKTLGLYQQKTVTEIRVVEEKQTTLIVNYVDAVAATLMHRVLDTVTAKGARSKIEEQWDEWVAEASTEPLRQIESAKVEV